MTKTPQYRRLLDVALMLRNAGRVGVSTTTLLDHGYNHDEAGKRALMRDLDELRAVGLQIDNAASAGEDARYVLRPGDTRLRLAFTAEQRTALQAALATARREGFVSVDQPPLPVDLDRVAEAVRARCLVRFEYNGSLRECDPMQYSWSSGDVFLEARERASGQVKSFAIRRMLDVEIDAPGTAEVLQDIARPGQDPITWLVDPPTQARVSCPGFTDDAVALLGGEAEGDVVTTTVTNRLIFFARLMELGSRVVLEGPEELRQSLRDRLREVL